MQFESKAALAAASLGVVTVVTLVTLRTVTNWTSHRAATFCSLDAKLALLAATRLVETLENASFALKTLNGAENVSS